MKTSRQQVLEAIRTQKVVSASDLSRLLQMTEANARHHLKVLKEDGLVVDVGKRILEGKGRPERLFSLSETAAGQNVDLLASALLDEIGLLEKPLEEWIAHLATHILDRTSAEIYQISPAEPKYHGARLTQRLFQAVHWLSQHHYDARWEAHAIAPRLILAHCPYAAILPGHPELCQLDRSLLEGLTGAPVEQIARLQQDRRGVRQCIFAVHKV